ncbi:MAG: S8 family peptidase [Candidatus Delongbacteria bacterium]|nr:S8 family peptidase [Candidatus Delongbacteria bacterium]
MRYSGVLLILILLLTGGNLSARTWVFFNELPRSGEFAGTDRAVARLLKAGVDPASTRNQSVDPAWIAELQEQGAVVYNVSRWLNAVSIADDPELSQRLAAMWPVREVRPVKTFHRQLLEPASTKRTPATEQSTIYGGSWTQLAQMGVPTLHDLGYTGEGVFIGMLDTGWQLYRDALAHAEVVAVWDFYNDDPIVEFEEGDHPSQDHHGTSTLGCIAAWAPTNLVGAAYDAAFALAKTEHVDHEINAEEDDFVAGLEWLDSLGVDIVSTSLGYSRFDPGQQNYTIDDLNGDICITTVACDLAAARGIFVVTSAGNTGNDNDIWHGLITSPADGDSVMAVGAVAADSLIALFSSRGPTADGRIKPDFVAMGAGTWIINTSTGQGQSSYTSGYGTSFAGPLLAGAAALLLQIDPGLLPMELATLMKAHASHGALPDTAYGWGLVDLPRVAWALLATEPTMGVNGISVFPNPFNNRLSFLIDLPNGLASPVQVDLYDLLGRLACSKASSGIQDDDRLLITLLPPAALADGIYFAVLTLIDSDRSIGQVKCIKLE